MEAEKMVRFTLGDMVFEYDEEKNRKNIEKHGISFKSAAWIFFDYDRIEMFDEEHSEDEDRYNTIGDTSAGNLTIIGNPGDPEDSLNDILFAVYTERETVSQEGKSVEVTKLISARLTTSFERGLYYGKYNWSLFQIGGRIGFYRKRAGWIEPGQNYAHYFWWGLPGNDPGTGTEVQAGQSRAADSTVRQQEKESGNGAKILIRPAFSA